jgi:hypothetical protein
VVRNSISINEIKEEIFLRAIFWFSNREKRIDDSSALESYIYFWRVVGYLHGLDDEFNPFAGSVLSARRTVYEIAEKVLIPSLENPDSSFIPMAGALFKKSGQVNAFILYAIDLMIEGNGLHGRQMPQERLDNLRHKFPVSNRLQLYRKKLVWQRLYRFNLIRVLLNKIVGKFFLKKNLC